MVKIIDSAAEIGCNTTVVDEEAEDDDCQHLVFVAGNAMEDDGEEETKVVASESDYRNEHWARATAEAKVCLGGLAELVKALVDNGSKINIMSKEVYDRGQWPIDLNHKWMIRGANNLKGDLYGACPEVPVKIGDIIVNQHFFVQTSAPYPVLLGMPYITAVRMETKVMNDGSHYARIRSLDDRRSVQFLTVRPNHERNRRSLRDDVARRGGVFPSSLLEAEVHTKYKVKPVATQLPRDSQYQMESAAKEPELRDVRKIGHKFTADTLSQLQIGGGGFLTELEKKVFKQMIARHGKAFAFSEDEIGCVDPKVIAPMVIFTIPHVPWDLKPIPVPRALLSKLIDLLKEKMSMGILEPSMAPYSSRWFTVPKKNGALRFIQDLQPANSVTIRNMGAGPIVDEVADEFAGRSVYSIGDLYSGYDQFQLAVESRDLTTMRTPLGLMRMCTLPQGATNSVAHMQNAMHKVLREFVPKVTIPFLDDIPVKGCAEEEKDETMDELTGCRKFVADHIHDVERILQRLEEVHLTLSEAKSRFGVSEILVVGHLCGSFGKKPNPVKVDAIARMADCGSVTEVRRFLGCCIFYRMSVPHYAHVADPLYALLKKGRKFLWGTEQREAVERLKRILQSPPVLQRLNYDCGRPIIITVDTSPKAIGWAVGQDDENGVRFASRFGAKILASRQREYPQVKRELWGVRTAMRTDRDLLIGAHVVLETDCLPLLGMIANCTTPDIHMLRWIAYIRSLNPELRHIAGKVNVVADMLSRARYENEDEMLREAEKEEIDVWCRVRVADVDLDLLPFREYLYSEILREVGFYLSTLRRREDWNDAEFSKVRRKAYGFLLRDGYLWKRPKRSDGDPLRVVDDSDTKQELLKEFHESLWAGHRGVWATYMKLKERESLLALRIRQLEKREEDLADAQQKLKEARLKNKGRFDRTHRLRPRPIQAGDWVLVYDSTLENQHSTVRKFSRRWFGPYVVVEARDNATYVLCELNGTQLRTLVVGKRVKIFKRRDGTLGELSEFLDVTLVPEEEATEDDSLEHEVENDDSL
ncbi:hypothetical protein R1sor_003392 [Riccia sorocarpa]|uniref:Peptidase A2 domain-containing protein n=1 Tax=Riccia sorocarpa TaxID=122646 RepID=A0ABD3H4V0_9MARC